MEVKRVKSQVNTAADKKKLKTIVSNAASPTSATVAVQCDSKSGEVGHGMEISTCDLQLEKKCVKQLLKMDDLQEYDRCKSPLLPWNTNVGTGSDIKMFKSGNNKKIDSKNSSKNKINFLKKNVSRIAVKRRSGNPKDGFFYRANYSQYVDEYRKRKRSLTKGVGDSDDHYTMQDIQKLYNDLKSYPKIHFKGIRAVKTEKVVPRPNSSERSRGSDDTYDAIEDDENMKTSCGFNLTPHTIGKVNSNEENLVGTNEDMDDFIDRHLGRSFFGYTHRCPVIDIAIPEKHTITRVANESGGSSKSRATTDSGFIYGIDELAVSEWGVDDDSRFDTDTSLSSSFYSNAVSPITKASDSQSTQSGLNGLNAAIRDLQPFGRNGIKSRLKISSFVKASSDNGSAHSKNNSSGYGSMKNESDTPDEKQPVPWKALKHLGYKPSMRKYLKEIYTPIKKERSLTSAVNKNNNCFIAGRPLGGHVHRHTKNGSNELYNNAACSLRISGNESKTIAHSGNSEKLRDFSVIHTIIEKRLLGNQRNTAFKQAFHMRPREGKTNLAIVSKCKTVVRPPVSSKHLTVN